MSHAATDLPRRHRLTVADYYRMAEVGILDPEARVELIDGEIIDMAPPGSRHAGTVNQLVRWLARAAGEQGILLVQNPVSLSEHSEPQPDLAVARPRADFYKNGHPQPADLMLVVEVADTSLRFDRDVKVALYARHAIAEVWLIDLPLKHLVRYRGPLLDAYQHVDQPDLGTPIEMPGLPSVRVDLSGLFGSKPAGEI
jgi:Uma2 family endonuclease